MAISALFDAWSTSGFWNCVKKAVRDTYGQDSIVTRQECEIDCLGRFPSQSASDVFGRAQCLERCRNLEAQFLFRITECFGRHFGVRLDIRASDLLDIIIDCSRTCALYAAAAATATAAVGIVQPETGAILAVPVAGTATFDACMIICVGVRIKFARVSRGRR